MAKACKRDEIVTEMWAQLGHLGVLLQPLCVGVVMDQYWLVKTDQCNANPPPNDIRPVSSTYDDPVFSVDGQTVLDLTPLPRPLPGKELLLSNVKTACSNLWIGGEGVATPYGLQFVESSCWTGAQIAEHVATWATVGTAS